MFKVSRATPGQSVRDNLKTCHHRCLHKDTCAHECCKVGVSVKTKAPVTGMMESYRQGLKTKLDNITGTPNRKRLKVLEVVTYVCLLQVITTEYVRTEFISDSHI